MLVKIWHVYKIYKYCMHELPALSFISFLLVTFASSCTHRSFVLKYSVKLTIPTQLSASKGFKWVDQAENYPGVRKRVYTSTWGTWKGRHVPYNYWHVYQYCSMLNMLSSELLLILVQKNSLSGMIFLPTWNTNEQDMKVAFFHGCMVLVRPVYRWL